MTIHCPTCSRSSDDARFMGDFCEFCTAGKLKSKIKDQIDIYRCRRCGDMRVMGRFRHFDLQLLGELINSELRVDDCTAKVKSYHGTMAMVEFACHVDGGRLAFEKPIGIKTKSRMCDRDYKISSGYYEALVQLRGNAMKCEGVAKRLAAYLERRGAFIAKREQLRSGIDMYASDKKLTSGFFADRGFKPQRSFKLSTVRAGRSIYRNVYLLALT